MARKRFISNMLAPTATAVALAALSTGVAAQGQTAFGHELLPEQHEISLALSAAPVTVAANASVWVLRREGFAQVRSGTNGFNCLVQRANDTSILAPTCFDAAASETIMMVQQYQAKLWGAGKSAAEVDDAVAGAWRSGELQPPARGAVGYMMSSGQHLGQVGNWRPHMMIYAPYVTEQDIGADQSDPKNPVRMLNPGRPDARIVVIVPDFVNPGDVSSSSSGSP